MAVLQFDFFTVWDCIIWATAGTAVSLSREVDGKSPLKFSNAVSTIVLRVNTIASLRAGFLHFWRLFQEVCDGSVQSTNEKAGS